MINKVDARCERCGRTRKVRAGNLKAGKSKVCKECGYAMRKGRTPPNKRHGESHDGMTSEYSTWKAMHRRCKPGNDHSKHYHDRGIAVCARWSGEDGFANFLADMGRKPTPKHSIDRVDVNGNYEPSNCRWATHTEQMRNTRRSRRPAPAHGAAQ